MIDKIVYSKEYTERIRISYKADPQIVERAIYALGLLEALVKTNLDFIFKGGSSMMLLLDKPLRLSTDIDIIVKPGTDILYHLMEASKEYPFIRYEENIRIGDNRIVKKHYKFYYQSLRDSKKETPIILDILFDDNHYPNLIKKEIKTEFLETIGEPIYVSVPSIDSLIGDKLTAFAPHTIGVKPIVTKDDGKIIDKRIETIKQFFDVASLYDYIDNFDLILKSYKNTAEAELSYRGLNLTYKDCLIDTFDSALSILSKGKLGDSNYKYYLDGIRGLTAYLINIRFNAETSYIQAAKVMYLSVCLLNGVQPAKKFDQANLLTGMYSKINNIRKYDIEYFNIVAEAIKLFEEYVNSSKWHKYQKINKNYLIIDTHIKFLSHLYQFISLKFMIIDNDI